MKTTRKLKCDVSNNFPNKFLEKKKPNKIKFESKYDAVPQRAVAGTKHTVTTDTNKIIHRKIISKPLSNSFQYPYKDEEKMQGPDGRFIQQTTFLPINPSVEEEEEEGQSENAERRQSTPTPITSTETMEERFEFSSPVKIG